MTFRPIDLEGYRLQRGTALHILRIRRRKADRRFAREWLADLRKRRHFTVMLEAAAS